MIALYVVIIGAFSQFIPLLVVGLAIFFTAIMGLDPIKYLIEDYKTHHERQKETKARRAYAELLRQLRKEGVIRLRWENEGQEGPVHAN